MPKRADAVTGLARTVRLPFAKFSVAALSLGALIWAGAILPSSERLDALQYLKAQLLRGQAEDARQLRLKYQELAGSPFSDCDTDSVLSLSLIEIRLSEATLRQGQTGEFDRLTASLNDRVRRGLACSPRQPFLWLMAFSTEILRGRLEEQAQEMLRLSYETGENEGWVAIRRNIVAIPLAARFPADLQSKIALEFGRIVASGYYDQAALSYAASTPAIRGLLQDQIDRLRPTQRAAFSGALEKRARGPEKRVE